MRAETLPTPALQYFPDGRGSRFWEVSTPGGGNEWIIIIASLEPWTRLEESIADGAAAYPEIQDDVVADIVLRGVGGIGPPRLESTASGESLVDSYIKELEETGNPLKKAEGFWIRKIRLTAE